MPESSADEMVSRNIRQVLEETGRKPGEVSRTLGHAYNWLYRVMNGQTGTAVPTLRRLALELDVPIGRIIGETGMYGISTGVMVPEYTVDVRGEEPRWKRVERTHPVPEGWLGNTKPDDCVILTGTGHECGWGYSPEGTRVLVDRMRTEPRDGAAFIVAGHEGAWAKRIIRKPGLSWYHTDDRPPGHWAHQTWPLDETMTLMGTVLGWWWAETVRKYD